MKRAIPAWFHHGKVGLLFYWGVPSLGGFGAPPGTAAARTDPSFYRNHPEGAWYLNGLRQSGSAVREHHNRHLSRFFGYDRMARRFADGLSDWDASVWPELAKEVGARYLITVAKQPDGFLMWPSEVPPERPGFTAPRDLVGDLAIAARELGLRFGVYYSGRLDWQHQGQPITSVEDALRAGVADRELAGEVEAHYRELITRYEPDILWNDTGVPRAVNVKALLRDYHQAVPHGLANDRWGTPGRFSVGRARRSPGLAAAEHGVDLRSGDIVTIDVDPLDPPAAYPAPPFEAAVPLGRSWSYSVADTNAPTGDQLIQVVADIVAAGGNTLLVLGPDEDGAPPTERLSALLSLGAWLRVNAQAVYGTRAWRQTRATTVEGIELRYTCTDDALYVITRGHPRRLTLTIPKIDMKQLPGYAAARASGARLVVRLLGYGPVEWEWNGPSLRLTIPGGAEPASAFAFRIGFGIAEATTYTFDWFTDLI